MDKNSGVGIGLFFGFIMTICGLFLMVAGVNISESVIVKDCESFGQFRIGDTVYECSILTQKGG